VQKVFSHILALRSKVFYTEVVINLIPFRFLLGYPIHFIPFPLIRGTYIREASPPFDSPFKERGEILERGEAPLLPTHPLPYN